MCELVEDVIAKGVDGVTLDFERKAPFFPDEATDAERMQACTQFLAQVRALTDKPLMVRVSHQSTKGAPQGQDPEQCFNFCCFGSQSQYVPMFREMFR